MKRTKGFILNLIGQFVVFASNIIINFFFTPYVLEKLGTEAYGFIGLINNFISYISIVTIALNSMAGRYITISYHRKQKKVAEEYYSSVFFANLILSGIIICLTSVLCFNIEKFINIPTHLLKDVQITIIISTGNAIVALVSVVYGIAAFIKNKLYMNSVTQMLGAIVKILLLLLLFGFLKAHMWYYTLATIVSSLIVLIFQRRITNKLCPELEIKRKNFKLTRIFEIVRVGVWVSVESFNKVLQTGLDLLISNVVISADATGILSVAKTVPSVLTQITSTITTVFNPELARLYAEDNRKELIRMFKTTMRILSAIMIVPLIGFIVFGLDFYTLWLPQRKASEILLIQKLSILTVLPLLINAYVEGLYYANTLTNKVKGSVLITLGFSVASVLVEIILLKVLDVNPLYIIAGTSSAFMIIRYLFVTPIYSAYVLELPIWTFYPALLQSLMVSVVLFIVYFLLGKMITITSWGMLIGVCLMAGLIGYILMFFIFLNKSEKQKIMGIVNKFRGNNI